MKARHFPVVCVLALLLGLGLMSCSSGERIVAAPQPPVDGGATPDPPVAPDPPPVEPDPPPVAPDPPPVTPDPPPVAPDTPVTTTPRPTPSPRPVSAETGSNSDYDITTPYISSFDQDRNEDNRLYYVYLSHPGEILTYPEAAKPFASGTMKCQFIPWGACQAFQERNDRFALPRVAFLNEDGSFVRDQDDGVLDGMHNGVNSTECISDGPCTEEVLWRELVATDFVVTDSSTSGEPDTGQPDTVEIHVYTDHGETYADYYWPVKTDAYPMPHHLDYLKLGYWMKSAPGGPWEYGGAFYRVGPDYSIAIDSTTRGIRGTATYDGRTVGVATLGSTARASRVIGEYTGRVTLVADFGAAHETGNSFTISGRVEELSALSRTDNSLDFAVFTSFDLGPIDGDVAGGVIQTSQGAISTGPDDLNDYWLSPTGELAGTWDISFHGRANRARIPGTNAYFHRAPPVVAGNIRAEGTWQQSSSSAVRDMAYDGVFGAYKTNETHD